jgi:hypothetical protein
MTPEDSTSDMPPPNLGAATGDAKTSNPNDSNRYCRGGYRKPSTTNRPVIKQPKFEGKCKDLKGHIYDCTDARQSDILVKTMKEISEYVGNTFKKGSDARLAVESLTLPILVISEDPKDESKTKTQIWEKEVDEHVKHKNHLADNMQTVYSLVWGQCTDIMRQKVKALPFYEQLTTDGDGLALLKAIKNLVYNFQALLKAIKNLVYNFQSQKYLPQALHESKRCFYFCVQGRHTTTSTYIEQFQNIVDVIEHSGGSIGKDPEELG